MKERLSYVSAAIILIMGSHSSGAGAESSLVATRQSHFYCDKWFRLFGLDALPNDLKSFAASEGFRVTQVSSWGISRYTVVTIAPSDEQKGQTLLIWDRASWTDSAGEIASRQQKVRKLNDAESKFLTEFGFDNVALWEKERFDEATDRPIVDGGVTFIEWVRNGEQKFIRIRVDTGKEGEKASLYKLLKKFTELRAKFK